MWFSVDYSASTTFFQLLSVPCHAHDKRGSTVHRINEEMNIVTQLGVVGPIILYNFCTGQQFQQVMVGLLTQLIVYRKGFWVY
jgi:hypothetical protein